MDEKELQARTETQKKKKKATGSRASKNDDGLASFNHDMYALCANPVKSMKRTNRRASTAGDEEEEEDSISPSLHCQGAGSKEEISMLIESVETGEYKMSTIPSLLSSDDDDDHKPPRGTRHHNDEDRFRLIGESTAFFFCDPRECKHKSTPLPYTTPTSLETQVALDCLNIARDGEFPGLLVTEIDGLGKTLHTNEKTTIYPGAYVIPYLGEIAPAEFSLKPDHPGYDKLLTIIPHKADPRRDIVCDPSRRGGVAHFAACCSPKNQDYENCNIILLGKNLSMDDDQQRVVYFFVAIKEIPPNTALVSLATTVQVVL